MGGTLGHSDEHRRHVEYGGSHSRVTLEVLGRIARRLQDIHCSLLLLFISNYHNYYAMHLAVFLSLH